MFQVTPTPLDGVFVLRPNIKRDNRGFFVKMFQKGFFENQGWEGDFGEVYYSTSDQNVLRGLHFQVPPHDGAKAVGCLVGEVYDVLLDLRTGSKTFGQSFAVTLKGAESTMIYMPSGIAHGFWTSQGPATMVYLQHAQYTPGADQGIAWNKAGIQWPCTNPVISERDATFPALDGFKSPF